MQYGLSINNQLSGNSGWFKQLGKAMSNLMRQKVTAEHVMEMINARLESIKENKIYSAAEDGEKWGTAALEVAELKMQFVDFLANQLDSTSG